MANYTKTTDFAAKDTLPGGDTNKVVRGSEFETEFDAISTAIATKSDTASPTFTGTVTIPTADINGGNIDGTVIGASSAAAGTFTNLVVTSADINGGTVDGATIGGSSAGAGTFTNLTASGTVNFNGATISNLGTITTANLDGGTADNIVIGGSTPAAGTFTSVVATTADINGGTIDGVSIGSSSAGTGAFSSLTVGGSAVLTTVTFSNLDAGSVTTSSETFADSDTQIPTNAAVKAHVAAVTPTLSVTESSVTAHQAALAITASQLSDVTSTAAELNLVDGSTADTVVNSKAVIYGSAGQITANELDVDNIQIDANAVKSTNTNGNIQLSPNGTGFTELYGNTNAGAIRFNCEANSHGVTLKGPPHSASATYSLELPNADGTAGQLLKTDGNGKLAFTSSLPGVTASTAELNLLDGVTATTAELNYVDGVTSNIQTQLDNISPSPTFTATADGALTNGAPVIVTSDGKVALVSGATAGTSSDTTIESTTDYEGELVYDPDTQRLIYIYGETDALRYIVYTINSSGDTFTASSAGAGVISSENISSGPSAVYDTGSNKIILCYQKASGTNRGCVRTGTVDTSDDTVSWGTETTFGGNATGFKYAGCGQSITYDENANKSIVIYHDNDNNYYLMARTVTVSGTNVSVGTAITINSNNYYNKTRAISYNKHRQYSVIAGPNPGSSNASQLTSVGISGTDLSIVQQTSPGYTSTDYFAITYHEALKMHIFAFSTTGGFVGKCTMNANGGISPSMMGYFNSSGVASQISIQYHASAEKIGFAYMDNGDNYKQKFRAGKMNAAETSMDFDTEVTLQNGQTQHNSLVYHDAHKFFVLGYIDQTSSGSAWKTKRIQVTYSTLTTENYVGVADAAYSDGATATIQTVGGIDDAQSSLTPGTIQYVSSLGAGFSTSAGTPSVIGGVAISATKILISRS